MNKKLLPILAGIGILTAITYVITANKPAPVGKPIAFPAAAPFTSYISGAGIIEANTENIAIGTEIAGIVSEIFVNVGSKVKKGDPLFKIDDSDAQAQLAVAEASLKEAQAALNDAKDQLMKSIVRNF